MNPPPADAPAPRRLDAVIKLGGSVVSDKARDCTARPDTIRALGAALADAAAAAGRPRIALVHGTGSFGKPYAIRYGYLDGAFDADLVHRFLEIRNSLHDLARIVARELAAAGLAVAELDAWHAFPRDDDGTLRFAAPDHDRLLVARGATPLYHGDLYVCPRDGYRVVSSDAMTALLARHHRPRIVLFLSDVDGVLDPDTGELLREVTPETARRLDRRAHPADALDVSGGMSAKMRWAFEAARWCDACWITNGFHPERFVGALHDAAHATQGTRVRATSA